MMKKTKLRYILYFFNYSQLKMSKTLWTRCIMINSMQKVNTNQSNLSYLSIHCLERIFFIMFFLTIEESFLRWLNFSSKILQAWFQTFILPKLRRKEKKKLSHVFKIYLYIIQPFSLLHLWLCLQQMSLAGGQQLRPGYPAPQVWWLKSSLFWLSYLLIVLTYYF